MVAAAFPEVSPKRSPPSVPSRRSRRAPALAEIHLLAMAATVSASAAIRVSLLCTRLRTSITIPTPIRNQGMKMALPANSVRRISTERAGMKRLSTSPA